MTSQSQNDKQERKRQDLCPCQLFPTSREVLIAATGISHDGNGDEESAQKHQMLLAWFKGQPIIEKGTEFKILPDTNTAANSTKRVGAALCILNEIRDACRQHLEVNTTTATSNDGGTSTFPQKTNGTSKNGRIANEIQKKEPTYEDKFPSLSSTSTGNADGTIVPNVLQARKKTKKKVKITNNHTNNNYNNNEKKNTIVGQAPAVNSTTVWNQKVIVNKNQIQHSSSQQLRPNDTQNAYSKTKSNTTHTITKQDHNHAPSKRRIRPVSLESSSTISTPWGTNNNNINNNDQRQSTFSPFSPNNSKGNISSLPTATVSRNALHHTEVVDPMDRAMSSKQIITSSKNTKMRQKPQKIVTISQHLKSDENNSPQKSPPRSNDGNIDAKGSGGDDDNKKNELCHQSVRSIEEDEKRIQAVSTVYSTLIKNQLIPSIALELQLLLRLLCLTDNDSKRTSPSSTLTVDGGQIIKNLFKSPSSCRKFVFAVMKQIEPILLNLGRQILIPLIRLKPFVQDLPEIVHELQYVVQKEEEHQQEPVANDGRRDDDGTLLGGFSGNSNVAMLTVPFQEKRDSRHNYRSRNLATIFNNREESRDLFLSQLRTFQEMRGNALNPIQTERSLKGIRQASRAMIQNLLTSNIPWFAEYFCELLLQIGLIPLQETDKDILKHVGDKDKLQKLHSRFTSKATQKNKSSQRVDENKNLGPAPDQFFTGHQEFFFLFIEAVDSYRFGMHLREHLIHLISSMYNNNEEKELEQRILKLQLLAKFIGMLEFSPYWNLNNVSQPDHTLLISDETKFFQVKKFIEDAWNKQRLIFVIPWVLQFLRMAAWANDLIKSTYYQEMLILLRSIQRRLASYCSEKHTHRDTNFLFLTFQLESFFAEVIGLKDTWRLPPLQLPVLVQHNTQQEEITDCTSFGFSPSFILSSSSHLDELHKLIMDLSRNNGKLIGSNSASKKLKPYVLSINPVSVTDGFSSEILTVPDPMNHEKMEGFHSKNLKIPNGDNERASIQAKLIDAFFHQHQDLRQLCEFIVDTSVKNAMASIGKKSLHPIVEGSFLKHKGENSVSVPVDTEWYLDILKNVENDTSEAVTNVGKLLIEKYISEGMKALAPPMKNQQTKEMAKSLSIKYAHQKSERLITSLVKSEVKKEVDAYLQKAAKGNNSGQNCTQVKQFRETTQLEQVNILELIQNLTKILENYVTSIPDREQPQNLLEEAGEIMKTLNTSLKNAVGVTKSIGFMSIVALQEFSFTTTSLLKYWLKAEKDVETYPSLFREIISTVSNVGKAQPSENEMNAIGELLCSSSNMIAIINWDTFCTKNEIHSNEDEETIDIASCLVQLIHGNILSPSSLEGALIEVLESNPSSQGVAKRCLFLLECALQNREEEENQLESKKESIMPILRVKLKNL